MVVRVMVRSMMAWVLFAIAWGALAQDYPARTIRIIVPFPAGGTADILPRLISDKLAAKFGQPIVIENRPGAGGNIGAELVAKAEPDGYTLLSAPPPPLVINQNLYPKLAFDPLQFVPITVLAAVPNVLLVHPKVAAETLAEFISLVRAKPNTLNYASQGNGTTSHLTAELFKSTAAVQLTHVPYKGSAPALTDLLAGQVQVMFDNLGVSMAHIKSGRLRALAVGSERRIAALPELPTINESHPGFVSVAWFGMVAPPKTLPAIATKLSAAIAEALKHPDVTKRLAEMVAEPIGGSPAQTAAFMKEEVERWRKVIQAAGVKLD
jgi:tripartite-type tricarboxylate transporter receptor subunit TctC